MAKKCGSIFAKTGWKTILSDNKNLQTALKRHFEKKPGFALTLVLGPVHRGGCTVVHSSSRSGGQAAYWSLEPWRVTGYSGAHCPAGGTTAVHPHVSTGGGGSVTSG